MRSISLFLWLIAAAPHAGHAAQVQDVVGTRDVGAPPTRADLDRYLAQLRSSALSTRTDAVVALSNLEILPEQAREIVPLAAAMLRQWPTAPKPYPPRSLTLQNVALRFLQQLGPMAKPALPEVISSLKFDDPVIRWWALSTVTSMHLGPEESDTALQAVIALLERELTPEAAKARAQDTDDEKRLGYDAFTSMQAEKAFETWLPQSTWPEGVGIGFSIDLKFDAFRFLQELGPAAKPAMPVMLRLRQADPREFEDWTNRTFASMGPAASDAIQSLIAQIDRDSADFQSNSPSNGALRAIMEIDLNDPRVRRSILAAFERYVAALRTQAQPQIVTTLNLAVARIGPVDVDTVRAVVRSLAEAPDAAYTGGMDYIGPGGQMEFSEMAHVFLSELTPRLAEARPDFLALARNERPIIRQLGFDGLKKLGGIPNEFIPLFIAQLGQPDVLNPLSGSRVEDSAIGNLGSMGPRAAPAVPALVKLLRSGDLHRKLSVAGALARIGPPAVQPAIPELEKVLPEVLASIQFSPVPFLDNLLTIDPGSATARAGLDRYIASANPIDQAMGAHAILLKHGLDVDQHRTAILAVMDGADERRAIDAAVIVAGDSSSPVNRARAIDRLFSIVSTRLPSDSVRGTALRRLEDLQPDDSISESRLVTLIRAQRAKIGKSPAVGQFAGPGEWDLATLIRILARFETKSPETTALIEELRGERSSLIRAAAAGRPAIGF